MDNLHKFLMNSKKGIKVWMLILMTIGTWHVTRAQVRTGVVKYETLGIEFTIPSGWKGQESGEGFIIGHDTEPGMILISTHNHQNLDQIRQEARLGFQDENGTSLQLSGSLEPVGKTGLGGLYEGMMQWTPARFYAVALLNSHGYGLTILAGSAAAEYTEKYRQLAQELAGSVIFSKPETGPIVEQWKQHLSGKRLTYMDSYYSSSPSVDGMGMSGGGYSSEEVIDLCPQGYFNFNSSSDVSVDTGGAYGFGDSSSQGNGTWEIMGNANGGATLILTFNNGKVNEYELTFDENKTLLNGYRYYVTDGSYSADQAPQCY